MHHATGHTRWIAAGLAAATMFAVIAPAAQADIHGRRWKGERRAVRVVHAGPRYVERHGSAAPVIAGLVGGFILGAATAGAHDRAYVRDRGVACEADYRYVDPYCGRSYVSIEAYWNAPYRHRHPRVLRVIDTRHDRCVRNIRWDGRRWADWDGDDRHEHRGADPRDDRYGYDDDRGRDDRWDDNDRGRDDDWDDNRGGRNR